MSYAEIAHSTIERTRENGDARSYTFSLKESGAIQASDPFPVVGEVQVMEGKSSNDLLTPVMSRSVTIQIKDTGTLAQRLIDATYRQFQLTITETETSEEVFNGFIVPDFHEYGFFEQVKTVKFMAAAGMKEIQNAKVADNFRTLRELFEDASDDTGISHDVDFITRIREAQQADSDLIPNLIRANETEMLGTSEANRFEAISKLCEQMNWRLVQHDGRWVVADVYELWSNPGAVRRFVSDGSGGYTITSENRLISLDDTNSIRRPTGQGREAIGRIVLQRHLDQRPNWSILGIQNETMTIPDGVPVVPTITRTSGLAMAGDKVEITQFTMTLTAEASISAPSVDGTLKAVLVTFQSALTGTTLYFDYANNEWTETETYGEVGFSLSAGQEFSFDMATELPPIPEGEAGTITIQARLDLDLTLGTTADIDNLLVRTFSTQRILLPREALPVLYHQHIATSQGGAGKTQVIDFWHSDQDTYTGLQFMQHFDSLTPWAPIVTWYDEGGSATAKLGEMSARRRSVLTIGKKDRFSVLVRDGAGVNMLSVVDFNDGSTTHRCIPVHIKRSLFDGFSEVELVPVRNASFTSEEKYSFTKIEGSDSKVGSSRNIGGQAGNFQTGDLYNSIVRKALSAQYDVVTTADLSGSVTAIPVSAPVSVGDGDQIRIVDPETLNVQRFIVSGEQMNTQTISVLPKNVPVTLPTASLVAVKLAQAYLNLQAYTDDEVASATANLATEVYVNDNIANSELNLTSYVDAEIASATASLATEAYVNGEVAASELTLTSYVDDEIALATAGLATEIYVDDNILAATAGLALESYVDDEIQSASASVYAQVEGDVVAMINASADTINGSRVDITADMVQANGIVFDADGGMYNVDFGGNTDGFDGGITNGLIQGIGTKGWAMDRSGYLVAHKIDVRNSNDQFKVGEDGIALIYRDNEPTSTGTEISFRFDDIDGVVSARIYADTDDGLTLRDDVSGIFLRADSGDITIDPAVGDIILSGDTFYKGQELDARFGSGPTAYDSSITISAGSGLSGGGVFTLNQATNETITVDHADTSSQGDVNNSGGTVIQDVELDTYGHVTNLSSVNLDDRYLVESNNLSDLTNKATARGNLDLGTTDNVLFGRLGVGVVADSTFIVRVQTAEGVFRIREDNGNVVMPKNTFSAGVVKAHDFILDNTL